MLRVLLVSALFFASALPSTASRIEPDVLPAVRLAPERFPATVKHNKPLPRRAIVICADRPETTIRNLESLALQKYGKGRFEFIDGRSGPIRTEATVAYFGSGQIIDNDDLCLSRYPYLKDKVNEAVDQFRPIYVFDICGDKCPSGLNPMQNTQTLMWKGLSYDSKGDTIESYVSICTVDGCKVDVLLGLFLLEAIPLR